MGALLLNISVIYVLGIIFSVLMGIMEAWLYYYKYDSAYQTTKKLHPLFMGIRLCFIAGVMIIALSNGGGWQYWVLIAALLLQFPFWHDGALYVKWNNLNPKVHKHRWRDIGKSLMEFEYTTRKLFWFLSMAGILIIFTLPFIGVAFNLIALVIIGILYLTSIYVCPKI